MFSLSEFSADHGCRFFRTERCVRAVLRLFLLRYVKNFFGLVGILFKYIFVFVLYYFGVRSLDGTTDELPLIKFGMYLEEWPYSSVCSSFLKFFSEIGIGDPLLRSRCEYCLYSSTFVRGFRIMYADPWLSTYLYVFNSTLFVSLLNMNELSSC